MNIEQRITDVLEQDGVRPQPIKDYIDDIFAFSDLELYKDMSGDGIRSDFRAWWSEWSES
jgi:hypothetical protein